MIYLTCIVFQVKNSYSNDENFNTSVNDDVFENDDYSALKGSDVELIQQMMHGNDSNLKNVVPFHNPNLSALRTVIEDVFSSVIGDGFYYVQRIRVPTNHCNKNLCFFVKSFLHVGS